MKDCISSAVASRSVLCPRRHASTSSLPPFSQPSRRAASVPAAWTSLWDANGSYAGVPGPRAPRGKEDLVRILDELDGRTKRLEDEKQ
ncbi:hypothetical protein ACWDA9_41260, partial [Streptomyces sp. NPDC001193]